MSNTLAISAPRMPALFSISAVLARWLAPAVPSLRSLLIVGGYGCGWLLLALWLVSPGSAAVPM